ncbi:MAG: adenosylcobalamin-dependent ribonucleoside-diphosphate reductase, partial [Gammaproteobacteria bacterium]|nr:adenosylcobalamin-dependent ribonucleoside-diphosphate reductase [Gammaproteobacteria bacterium]
MSSFTTPIAEKIWDIKYRYRHAGKSMEGSVEETWQRVATAIARAEKDKIYWGKAFYQLLEDFRFLPGGRILAGAGTHHQVTLFNCFVMDIAEDSLPGIFTALQEGAVTLQQGGGVGYDFSVLRPQGSLAKKTDMTASGPVSFMRIWDTMCSVLLSTGARRGAMMGVLRCDHPDIEQFVVAKQHAKELRHFNISVMVSDVFMEAVKQDADWQLVFPAQENDNLDEVVYRHWGNALNLVPCHVYRVIKARALWETIIRSAYDYAEPGVLFGDTINRMNNLWYREQINATNPCGEIPLPAYGACNLGAINLTRFIISPFTDHAKLDWVKLAETAKLATRFLDDVIDVSQFPLSSQHQQAINT